MRLEYFIIYETLFFVTFQGVKPVPTSPFYTCERIERITTFYNTVHVVYVVIPHELRGRGYFFFDLITNVIYLLL